MTSSNIW